MSPRDQKILQQRPDIPTSKINDQMSAEEYFQNATLRPILKLQNDLFLLVFRNYITKHKNVFYDLSLEKKLQYIEQSIQKDIKFRNALKGMVIGLFTEKEYETYIQNSHYKTAAHLQTPKRYPDPKRAPQIHNARPPHS